ncbi:SRPBCC family protein [Isoptericola croceus]|uniref:SRPBCC family protein n=1 Tax=Isoptericola croceus TaxID=3031406 RepID=UPI0034D76AC5
MPTTFEVITECPCPPEALFDASLSIDAHVDSMAASRERAVGGVTQGRISLGETVTWRARHVGIWFRMTSLITALERPHRFVDEQVRGPFRSFVHEHEFTEAAGTTRMTDRITIAAPVLGRVAERLVLVPYLRRLIRTRNTHLVALVSRDADGPEGRRR